MKKAAIVDFMGTIAVPSESSGEIYPIPGAIGAIRRLSQEFDVYISSKTPTNSLELWFKKHDIFDNVFLFYGGDDGTKEEHLEKIMNIEEYDIILYIADRPEDFNVNCDNLIKIAVNICLDDNFENVRAYRESLTVDLIEEYMEG